LRSLGAEEAEKEEFPEEEEPELITGGYEIEEDEEEEDFGEDGET
jgi:hypothetical protein